MYWVLGGVGLENYEKKNQKDQKMQFRWIQIFEGFEPATFEILRQKLEMKKFKLFSALPLAN